MTNEEDLRRLLNDAATEIPAGNAPIAELVTEGRRSKKLRHIVQAASVAAVVAVIAVGAFTLGPSVGGGGNMVAQPTTSPNELALPAGTRLVGMNGVAVAVPENWGTNQTDDEKCDVPLENTVVFKKPAIGSLMSNWCLSLPERWSSLHWFSKDDEQIAEAIDDYEPAGDIGGVATFRNEIGPRVCRQIQSGAKATCLPNQFNGALIVPSKNVSMYVNSPRKATIEKVLGSVQLIPEGYTAVPDVTGLLSDSEVKPLVESARLLWENRCPEGYTCRMVPIEATDPAPGSVVPLGTAVRAVDEPDRNSDRTDDDRPLAPPRKSDSTPIPLSTSLWRPGHDRMLALIQGRIQLSQDGCVYLDGRGGVKNDVIWPAGYSADVSANGVLTLRDPADEPVGHVGTKVSVAGGGFSVDEGGIPDGTLRLLVCQVSDSVLYINDELPPL